MQMAEKKSKIYVRIKENFLLHDCHLDQVVHLHESMMQSYILILHLRKRYAEYLDFYGLKFRNSKMKSFSSYPIVSI